MTPSWRWLTTENWPAYSSSAGWIRFRIKTPPCYQYRHSHYKDEMVWDRLIFIIGIPIMVTWHFHILLFWLFTTRTIHDTGLFHDDVIKWKHFRRYWPFVCGIHRSPVNSPHKGQWCGALMFSLICAWIHGWVNNHEAGDLRCNHTHYDITVMWRTCQLIEPWILLIYSHISRSIS